jgi:hypothetical protein
MPSRTQSILIAGVAVGIIGIVIAFLAEGAATSPVGGVVVCFFSCLLSISVGLLATWHYTTTNALTIPGGTGAAMGALAGLVSGAIASLKAIFDFVTGRSAAMREEMIRSMEQQGVSPEQMGPWMDMGATPTSVAVIILMSLVISAILGAVGGAIGAALFKRGDDSPATSPDPY